MRGFAVPAVDLQVSLLLSVYHRRRMTLLKDSDFGSGKGGALSPLGFVIEPSCCFVIRCW
jgi:hypothetical protein